MSQRQGQVQYQRLAEPVSTSPETVTVDRWLPTLVQPLRPLIAAGAFAALFGQSVAGPVAPVTAAVPPISSWQPRTPTFLTAQSLGGSSTTCPVVGGPETTTIDRYQPTYPQPNRAIVYAAGTSTVVPVVASPEAITIDRYQSTIVQPKRPVIYARGTTTVNPVFPLPNPAPPGVALFGWYGPQPSRAVIYAGGSFVLNPFQVPPPVVSSDLMAAVVARLRSTPSVITALGEDTSTPSTTKIWADDDAMGQPTPPYLTYSEPGEDLSPESADGAGIVHYYGKGTFMLTLTDVGKASARTTCTLIITALDDAPLLFSDGLLLELRCTTPASPIVPNITVGSPTTYQRTLAFEYVVERVF